MSSLAEREKQQLLQIARSALTQVVQGTPPLLECVFEENLHQPAGAFVTLHRRKRLRGCVGQLPGRDALAEVVAHCARSAALRDSRFDPVQPAELSEIDIEVSVLSAAGRRNAGGDRSREARFSRQPRQAARSAAPASSHSVQLERATLPGGNLREGRPGTRRLERSRDADTSLHCGGVQRISLSFRSTCRGSRSRIESVRLGEASSPAAAYSIST